MSRIARRIVGDVEFAAVHVEHTFDLEHAVVALLATKSSLRVASRPRPLRLSEVRESLRYVARQGENFEHPIWHEYRTEPPDGPIHHLADWLRDELLRLEVFTRHGCASQQRKTR